MQLTISPYTALRAFKIAILPLIVVGVTFSLGVLFHVRGERAVEAQLRERMINVVALAAPHIDADLVRRVDGPEDETSAAYRTLLADLEEIRSLSPHVRYVYIMRRTDDPDTLAFVADADAILGIEQLDENGNGAIDPDEEAAKPGDEYPIEDVEALKHDAFVAPTVDKEITTDQWGRFISAYAPIRDARGEAVAILGIDMEADTFFAMSQSTFSMVSVLLVTLVGTLFAAYVAIILRYRRMEALRQLDAERTALLDLATHQLGMPLATFRWWVELLKDSKGRKAESKEAVAQLEEGVERMDLVLKALTDVTQLRDDALNYKPSRVDVRQSLDLALSEIAKQLRNRRQTVVVEAEKDLPQVMLDDKLLTGILRELVQNASFYSPEGNSIDVRARRDGRTVTIEVSDRGYGIPAKDLPYLFEKFRRGSNAAAHRPVGNGLGLYITKRVIERAKGRVRVSSKLNRGTTISITLPVT